MITVISIIAILTTFAIPQINKYIDKANEVKIISLVSEMNNTLLLMQVDNNEISIEDVISEMSKGNLSIDINGNNFKIGKYEGILEIEKNMVIAKVNKPNNIVFTTNGKRK